MNFLFFELEQGEHHRLETRLDGCIPPERRHFRKVLAHGHTTTSREYDSAKRIVRAIIQRGNGERVRPLTGHGEVVNHVCGAVYVAKCASKAEAHPVVDVDEFRPEECARLVFKEIRHAQRRQHRCFDAVQKTWRRIEMGCECRAWQARKVQNL